MRSRNVQNRDRQCDLHAVWSRNILDFNRRDGCGDLCDVSWQLQLAELQRCHCGLRLQRRVHGPGRRTMLAVWSWNVQDRERQCGVYVLRSRNILGFDRRDDLRGMSCEY